MKYYIAALGFTLLTAACTFTPQGDGMEAGFHPPLIYQNWHREDYKLPSGADACAVSSGYNGIAVFLSNRPQPGSVAVQSNRHMAPGAILTVTVGNTNFETSDTYFPEKTARTLEGYFEKGGTAYLEWSELSGPTGARAHIQNIVRLDDFKEEWKQCRYAIGSKQ